MDIVLGIDVEKLATEFVKFYFVGRHARNPCSVVSIIAYTIKIGIAKVTRLSHRVQASAHVFLLQSEDVL